MGKLLRALTLLAGGAVVEGLTVPSTGSELDLVLPVQLLPNVNTSMRICELPNDVKGVQSWRDVDLMGRDIFSTASCDTAPLLIEPSLSPTPEGTNSWLQFREGRAYKSAYTKMPLLPKGQWFTDGLTVDFFVSINAFDMTPRREILFDFGTLRIEIHYRADRLSPIMVVGGYTVAGGLVPLLEDEVCGDIPQMFTLTGRKDTLALYRMGILTALNAAIAPAYAALYFEGGTTIGVSSHDQLGYTGKLGYFGLQRRGLFYGAYNEGDWLSRTQALIKDLGVKSVCLNGLLDEGEACDVSALEDLDQQWFSWTNEESGAITQKKVVGTNIGIMSDKAQGWSSFLPRLEPGKKSCACMCEMGCPVIADALRLSNDTNTVQLAERLHINGGNNVGVNSTVTVSCAAGFKPSVAALTQEVVTCLPGGIWETVDLRCNKNCAVQEAAKIAGINFNDTRYEFGPNDIETAVLLGDAEYLEISCGVGYAPQVGAQTPERVYCFEGAFERPTLQCAPSCKPPVLPNTYKVVGEGTGEGSTRVISCAEGSAVAPGNPIEETIVCSSGQFSSVTMDCRVKCASYEVSEPALASYMITPSIHITKDAPHGSIAKISCAPGYTASPRVDGAPLVQPATITCMGTQWHATPFSCHPTCAPYDEDVSRYTWTPANEKLLYGEKVTLTCKYDPSKGQNHMLHAYSAATHTGVELIECKEHAQYFQRSMECFEGCTKTPLYDTLRQEIAAKFLPDANGAQTGAWPVRHGSYIDFQCRTGYSSDTSAPLGRSTCHEGKWTDLDLTCKRSCPQYNFDAEQEKYNGKISFPSKPTGPHAHGTVIHSVCADGADLTADVTVGLEHSVCTDGQWSAITVQCGNVCPEFDLRMAPAYLVEGDGFEPGSTRRVRCNEAQFYDRVRGPSEDIIFCADGVWSSPMITCARDCTPFVPPMPLENYNVTWATRPIDKLMGEPVPHGEQIAVTCSEGYAPESTIIRHNGEDIQTCVEGAWTPLTIRCRRDCMSPKVSFNVKTMNINITSYRGKDKWTAHHGTVVELSCKDTLTQEPPQIVTCSDGVWPGVTLSCLHKCRPWPSASYLNTLPSDPLTPVPWGFQNPEILTPALVEKAAAYKLFMDGAQVKVACRAGYTNAYYLLVKNDETPRDPISSCSNGIWTDVPVACKANCMDILKVYPASDFDILNKPEEITSIHGNAITLSCKEGYNAGPYYNNTDTVHCIDGKWSPTVLKCERNCLPVPQPPAGYLVTPFTGPITHGSKRVIQCVRDPAGIEFISAKSDWALGYHAPYITFEGKLYPPENQEAFFCKDGQWSPTTVMCLKKCPQYEAQAPRTIYNVEPDDVLQAYWPTIAEFELLFAHGATRFLSCTHGYSHPVQNWNETSQAWIWSEVFDDIVTCVDGAWSNKKIRCQRQCYVDELVEIEGGSHNLENRWKEFVPNGYEFKYECDRYHTQVPSAHELRMVRCQEGVYSNLGMECKKKCEYPQAIINRQGSDRLHATPIKAWYDHGEPVTIECRRKRRSQGHHANPYGSNANKLEHERMYEEELTCVDGEWSTPTLQCRWDCDQFKLPDNPEDLWDPKAKYNVTMPQELYWPVALGVAATKMMNLTSVRYDLEDEKGNSDGEYLGDLTPQADELIRLVQKWPKFEIYNPARFHGAKRTIRCNEEGLFFPYTDPNPENLLKSKYEKNEVVSYSECRDGTWSPVFLQCYKECPLPVTTVRDPEVFAFNPFGATRHASRVTVSCRGDYGAVGDMQQAEMICLDGRWTGIDLECDRNCMSYHEHALSNDPEVFTGCPYNPKDLADDYNLNKDANAAREGIAGITRPTQKTMPNGEDNPTCSQRFRINGNIDSKISQTRITLSCAEGYFPPLENDGSRGPAFQELKCQDGIWESRRIRCELPCHRFIPDIDVSARDVVLSQQVSGDAWETTAWGDPYKVTYPAQQIVYSTHPHTGVLQEMFSSRTRAKIECSGEKWTAASLGGANIINAKGATYQEILCIDGNWSQQSFYCEPSCMANELAAWAQKANTVVTFMNPNGGSIYGGAWLPFGSMADVRCSGGRVMDPPKATNSVRLRCERGSFTSPDILCMPLCPAPSLPNKSWRGQNAWFLVDGDVATATKSAGRVRELIGGVFRHNAQYQLMCPSKGFVTHRRKWGGGKSHRWRNSYIGLNNGHRIHNRDPRGRKTSLIKVSYDYECFNCRFDLGLNPAETGWIKDVFRMGMPHPHNGPFFNVRCINGVWEENASFSCGSGAHYLTRSKGSCVLCSHSWFQGSMPDFSIAADTQFGSIMGRFLISGYHFWGPSAVEMQKMSPVISYMVSYVGTNHGAVTMEFLTRVLPGGMSDEEVRKMGAAGNSFVDVGRRSDVWFSDKTTALEKAEYMLRVVYGGYIIAAITPYTIVMGVVRQIAAAWGYMTPMGLYDVHYEESTMQFAFMAFLGLMPIVSVWTMYISTAFTVRKIARWIQSKSA